MRQTSSLIELFLARYEAITTKLQPTTWSGTADR